jgi:predicted nucleic acid-binding protein
MEAHYSKQIVITVSRHTLSEIKEPIEALNFAQACEILPHYPIGTFGEQVAAWEEVAGTFEDAKINQEIQEELEQLAKSGNDIRDRGAYIDAINAHADAFVTSDGQFAKSGPAQRIEKRFGLRVITPKQLAEKIDMAGPAVGPKY